VKLPGRLSVDEECGSRGDPAYGVELVQLGIGHSRRGDLAADGMDDDVDPAERFDGFREESGDVHDVGDVGADGLGGAMVGKHHVHGGFGCTLVVEVVDDHGVAAGRQ